jgi:hypothetical protein
MAHQGEAKPNNPPGCTIFYKIESTSVLASCKLFQPAQRRITSLATARQGEAKPNNPPGCTLFSSDLNTSLLSFSENSLLIIINLKQITLRFIPRIYLIIKNLIFFKAFADPYQQRQHGFFTLK